MRLHREDAHASPVLARLSLEHTERLQQQQLELIRGVLEETSRSSSQLGEAKSLDDIVALNARLAGAQLERMIEFWATWWRAAGDTQKSIIDRMQSQIGEASDWGQEKGSDPFF